MGQAGSYVFTWNGVAEAFLGTAGACLPLPFVPLSRIPAVDTCGAAGGTKPEAEGTNKPSSLVLLHRPVSPALVRCLRGDSDGDFSQEGSSH